MTDEDQEPPQRQIATPPVPVVDPVEPLQVGLDRPLMVVEETEEARYSPASSNPYAFAKVCMNDSRSLTFGGRPCRAL